MDVTLNPDLGLFPAGTTIDAYAEDDLGVVGRQYPTGVPRGSATPVDSADVQADGTLAFTGLTAGTRYFGYAQVGGQDRYFGFTPPAASVGGGDGSSSAEVFEVTDLLIPAGTDWSALGHNLGSFVAPSASLLIFKLYLEVDAPTSDLFLDISDVPDYSVSSTPVELHVEAGDASALWNSGTNWLPDGQQSDPTASSVAHSADILLGGFSKFTNRDAAPDATQTVTANLHTSGPTDADITVVRARAAFLVI